VLQFTQINLEIEYFLMIAPEKNSIVLELVTGKGQLTILKDNIAIDSYKFDENSSHSQSLIDKIHSLMLSNNLSRHNIHYLSVLSGPGNFTSLRVAIASALGFARAAKIPVVSVSLVDVINHEKLGLDENIFIKVGKSQIIKYITDSFQMISFDNVSEEILSKPERNVYVDEELFSIFLSHFETLPNNLFAFINIAEIVGEIGFRKFISGDFSPVIPHYLEYGS
jgi:tRNA N6-adenosine threonylcarbamoyltransferase